MNTIEWVAVVVSILKVVSMPIALVIIVAIPWRQFARWTTTHQLQSEALLEGMEAILAAKVSLDTTPSGGAALLQGLARNKKNRREKKGKLDPKILNKIEQLGKKKAGVTVRHKLGLIV